MILKFQGFIGPAYTLKSVNVDAQSCINLYPELNEIGKGKEEQIAWLRSTPGLQKLLEVGTSGPIRLVHFDQTPSGFGNPTTRVFVVKGNTVYKLTNSGGTWSASSLGTLGTSTGPVRAASVKLDGGITVFVDGSSVNYLFWRYDSGGGVFVESFNDFSAFGYASVSNATHVINIDGYFIFCKSNSNQFHVSDINSLNVSALSFASAEGDPDNILAIIDNQRDLWVLGERATEVYTNTGNADFPFERVQGGFIEKGIAAKFSLAKIDNIIFWLGRDHSGQGIVYAAQGLTPQRISTHAIETAIQGYADMSTAVAYTYQSGGHSFYVINFAEATWVYDMSTRLWHQRAYTNSGTLERHRASFCAFIPEFGIHMVGDYANNKIYKFNDDYYTDDTVAITRMRASPHVSNGLKRIFCKSFQLDMETGIGLDGGVQGSNPMIMLQYSDDGGHTWSSEAWASAEQTAGQIGAYSTRVIWRRLGKFRDRIFRIKITDPVKVALIGAELDIEMGAS